MKPQYAAFNSRDIELFGMGLRENYGSDDSSVALSRAIRDVDPELKNAFTPEATQKAWESYRTTKRR